MFHFESVFTLSVYQTFVAGYAQILFCKDISPLEHMEREKHLISLMYFAQQYEWPAILNFHGSVLLEIQHGLVKWGDYNLHLESRTRYGHPLGRVCGWIRKKKKIPKYKQKYNYLEDKRLYWDMMQIEIGSFIIYYSKQNAKTKKAEEAVLQQKLSSLHKLMHENPTQETIANDYKVKAYGGLETSNG